MTWLLHVFLRRRIERRLARLAESETLRDFAARHPGSDAGLRLTIEPDWRRYAY